MSTPYRVFGIELSPYSVKVRSYLRFKRLPHEWIVRNPSNQEEFGRRAKLPLVPLVITPTDEAIQDSTPILEAIEAREPTPSIHPPDEPRNFLSALLEEYGDEWGNKWMFHYRWWYAPDLESAAARIAAANAPGAPAEAIANLARNIGERMKGRLGFVGSSERSKAAIEESFADALALLEAHLRARPFLFGARPVFADFGIWPQIYQGYTDPTLGAMIRAQAPAVRAYVERMLDPKSEGELEPWAALAPTLEPLLSREVGARFLPWSDANSRALAAGQGEFELELAGRPFAQQPQKYHARSLAALRARYAGVSDKRALDPILERTGCLRWLRAG